MSKTVKLVKIKTLRPIMLTGKFIHHIDGKPQERDGGPEGQFVQENQLVEVDEAAAEQFCDTKFTAPMAGHGHAPASLRDRGLTGSNHIVRAIRV